ncbi:MAG TPA: type II toxin-antitoxin system RelE/ParE family toxin [Candidatus Binatia bacterium]|nr:type II toxin-antitoxin system RelE/ParE family toxin [Candidatus Binatia bacterium]
MPEVLLERAAERDLKRLPRPIFDRIISHLKALSQNPRPVGCKKIAGSRSDWRIRVGDYRILYEIDDRAKLVKVMRVRHRREVYR